MGLVVTIVILVAMLLCVVVIVINIKKHGSYSAWRASHKAEMEKIEEIRKQNLAKFEAEEKARATAEIETEIGADMRIIEAFEREQAIEATKLKKESYEQFKICIGRVNYPYYKQLSDRLTLIRKTKGLSQSEAAKGIGITSSKLSSYEKGYAEPESAEICKISEFYGFPEIFVQKGYADTLEEHIALHQQFKRDEDAYLSSLRVSLNEAETVFPELLTQEDRAVISTAKSLLGL